MIESLVGLIAMLGMIWGAVIQQNTVLFDIMALIFVMGIAFFMRWLVVEIYGIVWTALGRLLYWQEL